MTCLDLHSEVSGPVSDTTAPALALSFVFGEASSIANSVLLALLTALTFVATGPVARAQPQDTIHVAGITLTSGDSATARRLLRGDLGTTSRRWARLRDSAGRGQAAKAFFQMARLAYPRDVRLDSMLVFFREAGTEHPDPEVQTEFLYGGIQLASSAERNGAKRQFYRRLTERHEDSYYAQEARRLFAPDSPVQAGKTLPRLELPKLSDSTAAIAASDFRGKVLLIDFWGSWCGPCIRAMPHLHQAYRKYGGENFTILSVAMRDTREAVQKFRSGKWEMPWHHAFVPKGSDLEKRVQSRFDVSSFPTAILVGPDGKILKVTQGVGSGEETAQAIRKALAGEASSEPTAPEGSDM